MKNSNKPINPIVAKTGLITHESFIEKGDLLGLTKREHFAILAMQGLLSNSSVVLKIDTNSKDVEILSNASILIADELLKQLEL